MKSIDEVDEMRPSKLRNELRARGYDHNEVLRNKLKDLMQNEEETKPTSKKNSTAPMGVPSAGQFKDHLREVVGDEHGKQHKRKSEVELEESAKDLMKMKNSLPETTNCGDIKDAETFEVEKILDVKTTGRRYKKRRFLIRWKGYPPEDDLWVDESNLDLPIEEYALSETAKEKLNG